MIHYEHSVIDVCTALHGDHCGSSDSLSYEERETLLAWLHWRESAWFPSTSLTHLVDDAVRALVVAVLVECGRPPTPTGWRHSK